jgi:hypothetical protein
MKGGYLMDANGEPDEKNGTPAQKANANRARTTEMGCALFQFV